MFLTTPQILDNVFVVATLQSR